MRSLFRRLFGGDKQELQPYNGGNDAKQLDFCVGDRVMDPWDSKGTIIAIDPEAEHGIGVIKVRMDDGREKNLGLIASGLKKMEIE
jgi:hypothetical protein